LIGLDPSVEVGAKLHSRPGDVVPGALGYDGYESKLNIQRQVGGGQCLYDFMSQPWQYRMVFYGMVCNLL
jgi:hypothetical protein